MIEGVYLHVPFCSYKCPYCDFVSFTDSPVSEDDYIKLLKKEMELYKDAKVNVKTVYFGGGTPSLLAPEKIAELLEHMDKVFSLAKVEEITIECNPESYTYKDFKKLLKEGVNRISLGVQTFSQRGLNILGRRHAPEDSIRSYLSAREAGFENINLDLIYAYPKQSLKELEKDLETVFKLKPDHLSAYMFTPYEDTPLGLQVLKGILNMPDEDKLLELYNMLYTTLKGSYLRRYEISNWAKEGFECKHNLLYWTMKRFLGFGVSAWGFIDNFRYGNYKNIKLYAEKVLSFQKPVAIKLELSDKDTLEEEIMLKLRLIKGLEREKVKIPEHLKEFFEEEDGKIGIKEEHMIRSNEIIVEVLRCLA